MKSVVISPSTLLKWSNLWRVLQGSRKKIFIHCHFFKFWYKIRITIKCIKNCFRYFYDIHFPTVLYELTGSEVPTTGLVRRKNWLSIRATEPAVLSSSQNNGRGRTLILITTDNQNDKVLWGEHYLLSLSVRAKEYFIRKFHFCVFAYGSISVFLSLLWLYVNLLNSVIRYTDSNPLNIEQGQSSTY